MKSEDVKTFVDGDEVLVAGGEEAACRGQSADEGGNIDRNYSILVKFRGENKWGRTESSCRSDANKTSNDTRAEAENAELAVECVIKSSPSQTTTTSGEVGIHNDVDTAETEICS